MENTPPTDTRSNQAALHQCKLPGKETRKHHFLCRAAATRLKHRGWALPVAPQFCHGLQGKGCNSHCGQLEQPVTAGHHSLGKVGLFPSSASKKAESSQGESRFLDPGPSTHDTTMGSLPWTTATFPLFQHQGTPSTSSSTRVSPTKQIRCLCTPHQSHLAEASLFLSTLSQAFCWIAFLKEGDLPRFSCCRGARKRWLLF